MPGAVLGLFEDNRYKSEAKKPTLQSVDIIGLGTGPELEKKLKYAGDVSSAVIFGRELVNSPANVLTPGSYGILNVHDMIYDILFLVLAVVGQTIVQFHICEGIMAL